MAKGDYIIVRTLNGMDQEIKADQNGRQVQKEWTKQGNAQFLVASLLTRGGTTVRELWVPVDEIRGIESRIKGDE